MGNTLLHVALCSEFSLFKNIEKKTNLNQKVMFLKIFRFVYSDDITLN